MDNRILIIGGSPCSGKSTVAEMIARELGAYYYKVDDRLSAYIDAAAADGKETCRRYKGLSSEEMWMQDPSEHCRDEFRIYEEISPYIFDALGGIDAGLIVTEGAAYTPDVMWQYPDARYIAMIPTPGFQITHYKKRPWVPHILEGCRDKQTAFDNWMERDILFAGQVRAQCEERGVPCIVNDGSRAPAELYDAVKKLFDLR